MNTPGHYVLNLALLGKVFNPQEKAKAKIAITIGSMFPDVPIFVFYLVTKFIQRLPESQIWNEAYYDPSWHNFIALSHSIPVTAIAVALCLYFRWKIAALFCGSMLLHCLFDLPLHNDDAHLHFFPFSDYRFISPISYWDPQHHATFVALGEVLLVLAVTPFVFKMLETRIAKIILIGINVVYIVGYALFYAGLYRFFS
ncbi:MAG: hypothetical protein J7647_31765 [Cyanobacteria bacterium SBLK]|nr:hypothetical protein [Cyanobacteria bacterium SBLK]